jgi:hypothetical protein
VYRFSGRYRTAPLLLTERVVEASSTAFVVDLTLEDGAYKRTARARYGGATGAHRELVSAFLVDADRQRQLTPGAFDAWMSNTELSADNQSGAIASSGTTVAIGGRKMDCTQTTYHVSVDGREATLKTLTSATFPWGDVGREITTKDGKVLYRAEVVDAGSAKPELDASR